MDGPPPPPPPHGENPNTTEGTPRYRKSTDLPDGPYDIFVIPPHSAGGGFLYLPSLNCHRNSFIAGSLSTLAIVVLWIQLQPVVKTWLAAISKSNAPGGMGVILLIVAVGFAGWYFGTLQNDSGGMNGNPSSRPRPGAGFANGFQYSSAQPNPGASYPGGGPPPNAQYSNSGSQYNPGGSSQPPPFNSHGAHPNGAAQDNAQNNAQNSTPKGDPKKAEAEWERAREETRRKEEIRRKMEAYKKKREAEEAERRRQQEREAMEKELKQRKEELEREAAAAKAAAEKEIRERAAREAAEREERIKREEAEREEKARREAAEKEAAAKEAAKKEAAARFAAAKEAAAKKFAAAKEAAAKAKEASKASSAAPAPSAASAPPPRTPSPKKPPPPSARTADVDDDAYSFRPYDRPRRPYGTSAPSVYSESSYAPSQSTARTTPPPSHRGPYMTKDPDKVIIRGVYLFNNAFQKTPIAQLVSGQGSVTDGLILRITTEGLFVDDDVRGVAQREWDVKAWTLKSVEVRIQPKTLQLGQATNMNYRLSNFAVYKLFAPVFAIKKVNDMSSCSQKPRYGKSPRGSRNSNLGLKHDT